jgi:hypothetical protein
MKPLLSVLVCSRRPTFLDQKFRAQCEKFRNMVEFLMLNDNDWTSVGRKWQRLFEMSRGEYVMRVDDDDIVHPQLLPLVLPRLDGKHDVVCFDVASIPDTSADTVCYVNPKEDVVNRWSDIQQFRAWTHLMPTRRDRFEGIEWPNTSRGEDEAVMEQMLGRFTNPAYLDRKLYYAFPVNQAGLTRNPRYE